MSVAPLVERLEPLALVDREREVHIDHSLHLDFDGLDHRDAPAIRVDNELTVTNLADRRSLAEVLLVETRGRDLRAVQDRRRRGGREAVPGSRTPRAGGRSCSSAKPGHGRSLVGLGHALAHDAKHAVSIDAVTFEGAWRQRPCAPSGVRAAHVQCLCDGARERVTPAATAPGPSWRPGRTGSGLVPRSCRCRRPRRPHARRRPD